MMAIRFCVTKPVQRFISRSAMKHSFPLLLLLALRLAVFAADEQTNGMFASKRLSFRITKPSGWFFDARDENPAPNKTAVLITKFREPYEGLNPSCRVIVAPLGALPNHSPLQWAEAQIQKDKRSRGDFVLLEGPKEVKVGGVKGAFFKAAATAAAEGHTFKVLIRAYFAADSEHVFKITMVGPPEGANVSEKEFAEILNSIAIGRK